MTEIQAHFMIWAEQNGINIEDKEDWIDWYKCWIDGFNTALKLYATWKDGEQLVGALQRPIKDCLLKESE